MKESCNIDCEQKVSCYEIESENERCFIQIVLDQGRLKKGREWWRFEKKLQDVAEINPNFPIIYLSNYILIQSGMDRQGRGRGWWVA